MNEQPGALTKTLASGGGVDWRPPRFQNNVRSEIQHMMMVMFLAVKFELPVLYSVDLLHAAEGFNSCWVGRSRIGFRLRTETCGSVYCTYADNYEKRESFSITEGTRRPGPGWRDGITQL